MFASIEFFIAGLFFCVVSYAADEVQQTPLIRTDYDGLKLEVKVPHSAGVTLFQNWTSSALAVFVSSYALQKSQGLNYFHRDEYSACIRDAQSVKRVAECADNVIESMKSKTADAGNTRALSRLGKSQIKQRIRTIKKQSTFSANSETKLKSSVKPFRTKSQKNTTTTPKKSPKSFPRPASKSKLDTKRGVKNSRLRILQKLNAVRTVPPFHLRRSLAFNKSTPMPRAQQQQQNGWVGEFRLSRAKREVVSKSDYELINKDGGRSPLGIFARSLRNLLREIKGMTDDSASVSREVVAETVTQSPVRPEHRSEGGLGLLRGPLQLIGEGIKLGLMAVERNVTDAINNSTLADDIIDVNRTRIQDVDLKSFLTSQPTKNIDEEELIKLLAEVSDFEGAFASKDAAVRKKPHGLEREGRHGQPLYFTKQNVTDTDKYDLHVEVFEKLYASIGTEQVEELNTVGFTALSKAQLRVMYGSASPYADREAFRRFVNADERHMSRYVEKDIKLLSMMYSLALSKNKLTGQWSSLVPSLLLPLEGGGVSLTEPSVLNPLLISPVALFPSVLGPFLLNPWTFSPILTSPAIDAPLIVLPDQFPALVFSPLVYRPSILTYGVVDHEANPAKRFSPAVLPLNSTPMAALTRMTLNADIFSNSSSVTETFSKQPVNLSPQLIHLLMFPEGSSNTTQNI